MSSVSFYLSLKEFSLSIVSVEECDYEKLKGDIKLIEPIDQLGVKKKLDTIGKLLCKNQLKLEEEILYDDHGVPHLLSGKKISITHSRNVVAMALSNHQIGIDLEYYKPEKIVKLHPKLLTTKEHEFVSENDAQSLAVVWGVKECLFKINDKNDWSFRESYELHPFKVEDRRSIKCSIKSFPDSIFYAFYTFFDHYCFCVASDSEQLIEELFKQFPSTLP